MLQNCWNLIFHIFIIKYFICFNYYLSDLNLWKSFVRLCNFLYSYFFFESAINAMPANLIKRIDFPFIFIHKSIFVSSRWYIYLLKFDIHLIKYYKTVFYRSAQMAFEDDRNIYWEYLAVKSWLKEMVYSFRKKIKQLFFSVGNMHILINTSFNRKKGRRGNYYLRCGDIKKIFWVPLS